MPVQRKRSRLSFCDVDYADNRKGDEKQRAGIPTNKNSKLRKSELAIVSSIQKIDQPSENAKFSSPWHI